VLVPYERLDDGKPAALVIDRLMRRLRCSAREAFDLGEALLALDADATVVAQYVTEARRRGVVPVVDELVAWAARLGTVAPVPDADALDHAEPLGDDVDAVTDAVADDTADLPACPRCGTPDTWEARQPAAFRALIAAIEACTSRPELAMPSRRLYAAKLSRGQAGVAWTRYRIP